MTIKMDRERSHIRAGQAAISADCTEGRADAIIRCRRDHGETDADRLCPRFDRRPEPCLAARRLTEVGCQKIFTEQMSGAVTDRPALHDALEFARSGDTLVETLRLRGIGFRSLTETLDTTTAQGRLVFHMFGALAEFERTLIRERTQAGLAAAPRAGPDGRATAEADGG